MAKIKFGTDGWRALIAQDFTFSNVGLVAAGVAHYLHKVLPDRKKIIIGYDKRFLSPEFAQWTAAVFSLQGYHVLMTQEALPTPLFSWCAKNIDGLAGAVVITASHNPPTWNGFKFKEIFGCSALLQTTEQFEQHIANIEAPLFDGALFQKQLDAGGIEYFDPLPAYTKDLLKQVDVELIAKAEFKVAVDTMHGSASGHFAKILSEVGVGACAIHEDDNPGFNGIAPEPVFKNLSELSQLMKNANFNAAFANDGDADRLGALDQHGDYFSTQMILAVVYWHMLHNKKKKWNIARSVSTTRMVDVIAQAHSQQCYETKVGFKFIAEKMIQNQAQIGGEESGGIGTEDHLPERDGFLTALLLLEAMATTGRGLKQMYAHLCKTYRPYEFVRKDLKVPAQTMKNAMAKLKAENPKKWADKEVDTVQTLDGFKYYMKDGAWLLIRPSGTEPLFRLYAESESMQSSEALITSAQKFVNQC